MRYFVSISGEELQVDIETDGVRLNGKLVEADLVDIEGTEISHLLLDGLSYRVLRRTNGRGVWSLRFRGAALDAEVIDERTRVIRQMTGASSGPMGPQPIKAPMPGLVVTVEVAEGDSVVEGQGVVIVEAMKMENELRTPVQGRVAKVHVVPGQTVEKGQVLIEFDSDEIAGEDG